ncbi:MULTISPECIES: DUF4352 domain-containing protein [Microbacterium]|uniref:DUF4352 domain-containing protein n=1 Tax=Microbacterium TaxID=33882 RepID=UPI00217EFAAD|nr:MULTISPECIES: DUF4352 domain-containing protein [Microbacterium]UWF77543.1 DUF4352 domain-containing protein [Microbacterium neungamense]WCM55712.1 DUF4352 domain-containing protein [Microbacterium sp. EF45047]
MSDSIPTPPAQPPAAPYGAPAAPVPPPAPERKRSVLTRWWFWVIAGVVVLGVVGAVAGGGDRSPESASAPAAEKQAEDQPAEGAAEDQPAEEPAETPMPGIGEKVVMDGFEITVTSIETGVPSVGGEYASEQAQGAFTLLHIDVTNTGTAAETIISSSFTVRDAEGREFEAHPTASLYLQDTGFAFEQINPGNTASGIVVFDLPAGTAPHTLEFQPGMFGGKSVTIALT